MAKLLLFFNIGWEIIYSVDYLTGVDKFKQLSQ